MKMKQTQSVIERPNTNELVDLSTLSLLIKRCDPAYRPQLFKDLHPKLRLCLLSNKNLKSDLIESVYRTYAGCLNGSQSFLDSNISLQLLDDLSTILFQLAHSAKDPCERPWARLSEECCLMVAKTAGALFAYSTLDACHAIYSVECLPLISHHCSSLLEMAEYASWRLVRIQSLKSLLSIIKPSLGANLSVTDKLAVRRSLAHLLPGICQSMFRIVTGDVKIGSQVKQKALLVWTELLQTVFDRPMESEVTSIVPSDSQSTSSSIDAFSPDWYTTARTHLGQLISNTVDQLLHDQLEVSINMNHKLSLATVQWLQGMLLHCPGLLSCSMDPCDLLDSVVGALIAIASQPDDTDATQPGQQSSEFARSTLQQFEQTEPTKDVLTNPHLPFGLAKSVVGNRLIRRIAMRTLLGQVHLLTNSVPDESKLQKRLRTTLGYIRFLDDESISVLASTRDTLHRLITVLAELLCFNTTAVELFTDAPQLDAIELASSSSNPTKWHGVSLFVKSFHAFRDPRTLHLIQAVYSALAGQENTMDLFVDTCRDVMLQSGTLYRNPCLLLLTSALHGFLNNDSIEWEQRRDESVRIVTEFFESDLLSLPTSAIESPSLLPPPPSDSIDSTRTAQSNLVLIPPFLTDSFPSEQRHEVKLECSRDEASPKELKENTITVCLLLELFATASLLYRPEPRETEVRQHVPEDDSEDLLRIGLHECTARAAYPGLIGRTASDCLRYVASNCDYNNVAQLITRNADFLIARITLSLHRIILLDPTCGANRSGTCAHSPDSDLFKSLQSTCRTLDTLFQFAKIEALPLMRPLIKQVLACLDLTYEQHADLFLPALKRLMVTCRQWHDVCQPVSTDVDETASTPKVSVSPTMERACRVKIETLISETRRVHRLPGLKAIDASSVVPTTSKEEDAEDASTDEPSPRTYPAELHIVESTMLRCVHLLADRNPKLRLLSAEVLIEGYEALANDQDLLLPLVHKVWSPLMARFRDSHAVVVEKSFQLLLVLARIAGDFLRVRASTEIIPPLVQFLTRGANSSAGASDSYRHLTSYRVQCELLQQIGALCVQLAMLSESFRPVVQMLCIYLEADQPRGLQQASENSLSVLWQTDPGVVWTVLLSCSPESLQNQLFEPKPCADFLRPEVGGIIIHSHRLMLLPCRFDIWGPRIVHPLM